MQKILRKILHLRIDIFIHNCEKTPLLFQKCQGNLKK